MSELDKTIGICSNCHQPVENCDFDAPTTFTLLSPGDKIWCQNRNGENAGNYHVCYDHRNKETGESPSVLNFIVAEVIESEQ